MTAWRLEHIAWILAVLAAGVALSTGLRTSPDMDPSRADIPPAAAVEPSPDRRAISRQAALAAARNPFRLDRRPAAVAYQPDLVQGPPAPPPPRPTPALRGITGPPWRAIVDGVPGVAGSAVLGAGEERGGLRVRRITPDTVVLAGADTTWTLTVRRTWQ